MLKIIEERTKIQKTQVNLSPRFTNPSPHGGDDFNEFIIETCVALYIIGIKIANSLKKANSNEVQIT